MSGRPATIIRAEIFGSDELKALMEQMKWSEREALGGLALLWQGSQYQKLRFASAWQIGHWCRTRDAEETARLVAALSDKLVRVIKKKGEDRYEIIGNRKQIAKISALSTAGKIGGKKTRSKWKPEKAEVNQTQDAEPNARADARANATAEARPFSCLSSSILNSTSLPSSSPEPARVDPAERDDIPKEIIEKNKELLSLRERLGIGLLGFSRMGAKA